MEALHHIIVAATVLTGEDFKSFYNNFDLFFYFVDGHVYMKGLSIITVSIKDSNRDDFIRKHDGVVVPLLRLLLE